MVVRKTGKNGKIEKTGKINKKTNKKPKSESNTQLFPPLKKQKHKKKSPHTKPTCFNQITLRPELFPAQINLENVAAALPPSPIHPRLIHVI
jgi:hypothetical protein